MLSAQLRAGLESMQIDFTDGQIDQLSSYLLLLKKWSKAYNLTAITDLQKMVAYHVLDSLSILQQIPDGAYCMDVGTGAGLPGIPLAIMLPETNWVLLDSNGKKTRFVQQAIAHCKLSHVKVVQSRVQDYHAESSFDVIVSRAYSSIADFVSTVDDLWQPQTRLITMKTELSEDEIQSLDASLYQFEIIKLQVPGIAQKRSLVTLTRWKT